MDHDNYLCSLIQLLVNERILEIMQDTFEITNITA